MKKLLSLLFTTTFLLVSDLKASTNLVLKSNRPVVTLDTPKLDPPKLDPPKFKNDPPTNDLAGFGNYNFGGGNTGFSTPQAEVDYGFKYNIGRNKTNQDQGSYFEFRPSISTPVNAALKKNYIPALMLPGTASININTFIPIGHYIFWSPINLGLKFLSGFTDSAKTIIQHNLRTGISFQIEQHIALQAQLTWAWHNGTDESERNYNFVFSKNSSDIKYVTVTLQGRVSAENAKTPSYLIFQWRNLINPGQFPGLQNNRIFTIGFMAAMNLSTGIHSTM